MYTKPFYIVVNPVGSLFAKTLQRQLKDTIRNRVFRRLTPKAGKTNFHVTPRVWNKIEQFERFTQHGVSCPAWTTDRNKVRELDSRTVFARTLVNSTGGKGIVEIDLDTAQQIVAAPLYTAYIPKKAEFRFHVFNGQVIDVQQKKKKRDFGDDRDTRVRNLHNGYVYCRDGVAPPAGAADLAVRAVAALGYLYGAVDLVYNERRNQSYVLEVNSRPGLMGTTVERYVAALVNTYDLWRK